MNAVRDTQAMIAGMAPERVQGRFVFCTSTDNELAAKAVSEAVATYREAEGLSLILPEAAAHKLGFDIALPMVCITLTVNSSLEGIGLTAAVAGALTEAGIPCNMVAAYHHDHVYVPEALAERALDTLRALAAGLRRG